MAPNWRLLLAVTLMLLFAGLKADDVASRYWNATCVGHAIATTSCIPFLELLAIEFIGNLVTCKQAYQAADYVAKYTCLNWECPTEDVTVFLGDFRDCFTSGTFGSGGACSSEQDMSTIGCGEVATFRASLGKCQTQVGDTLNMSACMEVGKQKGQGLADSCRGTVYSADCMLKPFCLSDCEAAVSKVAQTAAQERVDLKYAYQCKTLKPNYTASCGSFADGHKPVPGDGKDDNGNNGKDKKSDNGRENKGDNGRDDKNGPKTTAGGMSPTLKWVLIVVGVLLLLAVLGGLLAWCLLAGRQAKGGKPSSDERGRKSGLQKKSRFGSAGPFGLAPPPPLPSNDGQAELMAPSKLRRTTSAGPGQVQSKAPSKLRRNTSAGAGQVQSKAPSKLRRNTSAGPGQSKAPSKLRRNSSARATSKLAPSKASPGRSKGKPSRKSKKASAPVAVSGWPKGPTACKVLYHPHTQGP